MTDEHLSAETLWSYQQRMLAVEALLAADEHLTVCADCRQRLDVAAPAAAAVVTLRADFAHARAEHLTFEQLSDLLEQRLDAPVRAQAEAHLQGCASCADEWEDLRAFSVSLTAPTVMAAPTGNASAPSSLERLRNYLSELGGDFGWLKLGALAACGLLIGWGAWRWQRRAPENVQIVQSNATPTPTELAVPVTSPTIAPVLLALKDGATSLSWQADGKLASASFVLPADEKRVRAALQTGDLELPSSLKTLRPQGDTMMGGGGTVGAFRLLVPVGQVTLNDRPQFQWQALPDETSYTVTVMGLNTDFTLTSPALTANRWTPPQRLPRGRGYSWQVVALRNGKEVKAPASAAPEARFRVVEAAALQEVARVRRAYPNQRLLLGLTYARFGLLAEAEAELQALAVANPQAAVVRQWLKALRAN